MTHFEICQRCTWSNKAYAKFEWRHESGETWRNSVAVPDLLVCGVELSSLSGFERLESPLIVRRGEPFDLPKECLYSAEHAVVSE